MRFINPKTDYAFKRIFGSDQSKDILISFLNAILYQNKDVILDLEILNPYSPGASFTLKDTYLDVKARLDNDTTVLIEMQVLNQYAFDKRVIYNAAKSYSNQLDSGERYSLLNPVIALTIIDFNLFEQSPEIINSFVFQEEKLKFVYNQEIKLVFVELRKFNKSLNELETISDKWLYFLRHATELREKPPTFQNNPALNKALEIANLAGLNREELEDIQRRSMWLADQEGVLLYAQEYGRELGIQEGLEEGLQQGLQQGLEQGLQQGLEQGLQEGIKRGKLELLVNLLQQKLGDMPPDLGQKIEQLSITKIDQITASILSINSWQDLTNLFDE